jgi:hypothetical protein
MNLFEPSLILHARMYKYDGICPTTNIRCRFFEYVMVQI